MKKNVAVSQYPNKRIKTEHGVPESKGPEPVYIKSEPAQAAPQQNQRPQVTRSLLMTYFNSEQPQERAVLNKALIKLCTDNSPQQTKAKNSGFALLHQFLQTNTPVASANVDRFFSKLLTESPLKAFQIIAEYKFRFKEAAVNLNPMLNRLIQADTDTLYGPLKGAIKLVSEHRDNSEQHKRYAYQFLIELCVSAENPVKVFGIKLLFNLIDEQSQDLLTGKKSKNYPFKGIDHVHKYTPCDLLDRLIELRLEEDSTSKDYKRQNLMSRLLFLSIDGRDGYSTLNQVQVENLTRIADSANPQKILTVNQYINFCLKQWRGESPILAKFASEDSVCLKETCSRYIQRLLAHSGTSTNKSIGNAMLDRFSRSHNQNERETVAIYMKQVSYVSYDSDQLRAYLTSVMDKQAQKGSNC